MIFLSYNLFLSLVGGNFKILLLKLCSKMKLSSQVVQQPCWPRNACLCYIIKLFSVGPAVVYIINNYNTFNWLTSATSPNFSKIFSKKYYRDNYMIKYFYKNVQLNNRRNKNNRILISFRLVFCMISKKYVNCLLIPPHPPIFVLTFHTFMPFSNLF